MALGRLTEEEYRAFGTEIIPDFLFLTSQFEAKDPTFLKERGITHLISVAEESPPTAPLLGKSLHLPLRSLPFRRSVCCYRCGKESPQGAGAHPLL
ncbi:unnamed protein product [Symbiodinium natans]|uniref:Uncharacterized protein n=1 Tax=Symbiodinium natans TaxID=878477 RepID=A0A812UMC5_9DINO|nr:unnamed protein product [Symbiodinium natans]